MKVTIKYIIGITCSLTALFSCTRFDEQGMEDAETKKSTVVFTAVAESGLGTKTSLGGNQGDEFREVLWQPGDEIALFVDAYNWGTRKFTNTEPQETSRAAFSGEIEEGHSTYYAIYPYSESIYQDGTKFYFSQASLQHYKKNSFSSNAMPMAAKATNGQELYFYALAGALSVNITGSETVKSVSFTGYNEYGEAIPVSGNCYVEMNSSEYPTIEFSSEQHSLYSVSLDCGDGVKLDENTPTSFYIVLPVGTYHSFNVTVSTTDGKAMIKKGTNPLTIKRANVTKAGSFAFVGGVSINLNEKGYANCHIVTEPGVYSLDATVIGNGAFGFVEGAEFHTTNVQINPSSAELLWDENGSIGGVSFSEGEISIVVNDVEGNAVIGAKNSEGNIVWSWHIWVTDMPAEQTYSNKSGKYVMMDRNLGATRTDRGQGENWKDAMGLLYQWGRKDPFMQTAPQDRVQGQFYLNESIQNPTTYVYGNNKWLVENEWSRQLWSKEKKTIYDPCPPGYRIPTVNVWDGFRKNTETADRWTNINAQSFDRGFDFYYDGSNTSYYPMSGYIDYWSNYSLSENYSRMWAADNDEYSSSQFLEYTYYSDYDCTVRSNYCCPVEACSVRCMRDEDYENTLVPSLSDVKISHIDGSVASIAVNILTSGPDPILDKGFVWGTSQYTLYNSQSCGSGKERFSTTIQGLESGIVYYIKAYVTTSKGTFYSNLKRISTTSSDHATDLSLNGTANCYIVKPTAGAYRFLARVKGNSYDAISPASAGVLWEVDAYRNVCDNIIDNVSLNEDGYISFVTPSDVTAGNALITAKNEAGTIIWSWHIWVVDYEPSANYQIWNSGAKMMDRNLGAAISIKSSSNQSWDALVNSCNREDIKKATWGNLYQWGRKDPLINEVLTTQSTPFNTLNDAHAHPSTFAYGGSAWVNEFDNYFWDLTNSKTKYDPCPPGWRVSNSDCWKFWDNDIHGFYYGCAALVNSNEYTYIPYGEYLYSQGDYYYDQSHAFLWNANVGINSTYGFTQYIWGGGMTTEERTSIDAYQVRCMKID